MMREIDGRVYDTEKAEEVARRWNGWGGGDYLAETLYRGDHGYFVETQYGEYVPDMRCDITPVGDDEAEAVRERLEADGEE